MPEIGFEVLQQENRKESYFSYYENFHNKSLEME
jgi:hypothetical protein